MIFFQFPGLKGAIGEFAVNFSAAWLLDSKHYHLIKNVTLPTEDGTTQIDHIIVSIYGIFVIETKNMKGWIFGHPKQKMWTQKIYGYSNQFQNPLYQNYKHVKTIQQLLGLNEKQVHSLIVFIGDSTFKTEMPDNVTSGLAYLKYIQSKKEPVLAESEIETIKNKINELSLKASFKTHREHVQHVNDIKENKEKIVTPKCPKCGSLMVLRQAKKGQNIGKSFWGCKNFPQCRGVLNITP